MRQHQISAETTARLVKASILCAGMTEAGPRGVAHTQEQAIALDHLMQVGINQYMSRKASELLEEGQWAVAAAYGTNGHNASLTYVVTAGQEPRNLLGASDWVNTVTVLVSARPDGRISVEVATRQDRKIYEVVDAVDLTQAKLDALLDQVATTVAADLSVKLAKADWLH